VGVYIGERLLLARHQGDEAGQHDVLRTSAWLPAWKA